MKRKDLEKIVFSKYRNGDGPAKIHGDQHNGRPLNTVKRCFKMISETSAIELLNSLGYLRTIRTPAATEKVKHRMNRSECSPENDRMNSVSLGQVFLGFLRRISNVISVTSNLIRAIHCSDKRRDDRM
jgi:hypothetical protein